MKKLLICLGVILGVVLVLSMFTFVVDQTQYVVLTQFGRPVKVYDQPGLKFKLPLPIQKVNRIDRRLLVFESRLLELLTKDKKNLVIKCYVCWRVLEPMHFFQAVGNRAMAEQRIEDVLIAKAGASLGGFEFEELLNSEEQIKIPELEEKIRESIGEQVKKNFGIEIVKVGISRLQLPETNTYSVYNRMREERKAIANKYRAEGQEQASKIKAEADRQKAEIIAEAQKQAEIIKGEGEAEAVKIYAQTAGKDPEFFKFWRTLQVYKKILDEKTTLILSEDSELFKYLSK